MRISARYCPSRLNARWVFLMFFDRGSPLGGGRLAGFGNIASRLCPENVVFEMPDWVTNSLQCSLRNRVIDHQCPIFDVRVVSQDKLELRIPASARPSSGQPLRMTATSDVMQPIRGEPGIGPHLDTIVPALAAGSGPAACAAFRLRQTVLALRHRAAVRLCLPDVSSRGLALSDGSHRYAPFPQSEIQPRKNIRNLSPNLCVESRAIGAGEAE